MKRESNPDPYDNPVDPLCRDLSWYSRGNLGENFLNFEVEISCGEAINDHCGQRGARKRSDDHKPPIVLQCTVLCW